MKNLSLALNIILLIAVTVLFYLHFSGEKDYEQQELQAEQTAKQVVEKSIAYINADSVFQNYDFFMEMQAKLEEKTKKLEGEYQNRAQGLQQEAANYQRNMNNLTMGQAKAVEEDLMKKQQNLRLFQDKLSQELMNEQSKVSNKLYEKVTSFLKDFSQKNNIELVLKYNQGSDVLYASDSMDITHTVIVGLNEAYKKEKEAEVASDASDEATTN